MINSTVFLLKLKQIVYITISNIYKLSSMTLRYNPKIKKVDAFKAIKKEKDNSIDLLITSPPYNLGKEYETIKKIY